MRIIYNATALIVLGLRWNAEVTLCMIWGYVLGLHATIVWLMYVALSH